MGVESVFPCSITVFANFSICLGIGSPALSKKKIVFFLTLINNDTQWLPPL